MKFTYLDWSIFLGIPILASLAARIWRRNGTPRAYFYASSQMNSLTVASTYLGANLTFTSIFLILSEEAYIRGLWVLAVPLCWTLGTVVLVSLYPQIKPYIEKNKTLHEAMGDCYDSAGMRMAASVWTIIAFVGTIGLEFYGAFVLLRWAGVSQHANLAIAASLALITSYFTVTGGLRGVAAADYVLNAATLVSIVLVMIYGHFQTTQPNVNNAKPAPHFTIVDNLVFVLGMIIIFVPFQLCTLDSWQRLVAWKDKNKNLGWLTITGIVLAIIYCIPVAVGVTIRNIGGAQIGHPFQKFLLSLSVPTGFSGLIFAGFAAAILSTADELLNCCGLSMVFDTLQLPESERDRNKRAAASGQLYTGVFAFCAALIALLAIRFDRKISDLALAVFSTQVVFTVPLIAMFKNRERARNARIFMIAGMAVGFIAALTMVLLGWKLGSQDIVDSAPVIAFVLSGLIMLVGWAVRKVPKKTYAA